VAHALATEGAGGIALVARTAAQCEDAATEIGAAAMAFPADLTDSDQCDGVVARVIDRFGGIDLVVHAAGISPVMTRAERHEPRMFRSILDVNVNGAFNILHAAAPHLFASRGQVVLVGSMLAFSASPRLVAYGASKAALVQLTRTLAREWGDRGVRVNAVCPGYTRTSLTEKMLEVDRIRHDIETASALGRLAEMREIVSPILFLASNDASYITGAALLVDGGSSA
jgi:3-oxoacyl-[acyl-carrier protein] reductase